jgi:hypothetical protein
MLIVLVSSSGQPEAESLADRRMKLEKRTLQNISVSASTGSISGDCPGCRKHLAITKGEVRKAVHSWLTTEAEQMEKEVAQCNEAYQKRKAAQETRDRFAGFTKKLNGKQTVGQVKKLRDRLNVLLEGLE